MRYLTLLLLIASIAFSQHKQKDPKTGVITKYSSNGNILEKYKLDSEGRYHGKAEAWHETYRTSQTPVKKYIENYKNGYRVGKQKYWFKNGQLKKVKYVNANGSLYGEFIEYYENGNKRNHVFRDNKGNKSGEERIWSEDGRLLKHFNFKEGYKHGDQKLWEIDTNNFEEYMLVEHCKYENGQKHGKQIYFDTYYGSIEKLENYKNGKKHGKFQDLNQYGNVITEENWYNDKKNGKFFSVCPDFGHLEYTENYKNGKKDGVCVYYHESEDDEDNVFQGIKRLESWKNGKLNGKIKEWGDNCFEDANAVVFPDLPKFNLILEENYVDGKKDGICRYWSSGSHGDWIEHSTLDHEGFEHTWETRGDWREGDFQQEIKYEKGKQIQINKQKDYYGRLIRNYGGMYLNHHFFQDDRFISNINITNSQAAKIKKDYKENIELIKSKLKLNIVKKEMLNDSIGELNFIIKKLKIQLKEFKEEEVGLEKLSKIEFKNTEGKINKKQKKILFAISEFEEKINSSNDKVDSKTRTIEQLSLELQEDSMRLSYYEPFIERLFLFINKLNKLKEEEELKPLYDFDHEYSKEYYKNEYVRKKGNNEESIEMFDMPFNISKKNIGPFYLGMTKIELESFLINDPYFKSCANELVNEDIEDEYNESEEDETSCAFFCDCRISIDTLNYNQFEDLIFEIKYEAYKNNDWLRPTFYIHLSNGIVHTIIFDEEDMEKYSNELRLVEFRNEFYFSQNSNDFILSKNNLKENDVYFKSSTSINDQSLIDPPLLYFFDTESGAYICFTPILNLSTIQSNGFDEDLELYKKARRVNLKTDKNETNSINKRFEIETWLINRFVITNQDLFHVNHGLKYDLISLDKLSDLEITDYYEKNDW